jgi:hypothetical protein
MMATVSVAVYCDKSQIYCDKSHLGWISNSAAVAIVGDNIGYLIGCALGLRLLMAKYSCLNELPLKVGYNLFLTQAEKSCSLVVSYISHAFGPTPRSSPA